MAISDSDRKALFGGRGTSVTDWSSHGKPDKKQDALGNKIPDPEEELRLIEKDIQELKVAFEHYFMGSERRSPARRRDLLWERLRRLKNADIKLSTGMKFRLEQTYAKLSAMDRVWTRSLQEIEAGTYARDVFKAKLRSASTAPAASPKPPPQPTRPSLLTDGQLKTLYDTFVMARRRTNEPTDDLTLETLGKKLDKQVPQLLQQYECKAVDFKVVIKNGKALLKAVPRK